MTYARTPLDIERYLRLSVAERCESLPRQLKAAMEELKENYAQPERFEAQREKIIAELEAYRAEVTELCRILDARRTGGTLTAPS